MFFLSFLYTYLRGLRVTSTCLKDSNDEGYLKHAYQKVTYFYRYLTPDAWNQDFICNVETSRYHHKKLLYSRARVENRS